MNKMKLSLGQNSYEISFHSDFDMLCRVLNDINAPKKLLVVTDTNVLGLYADEVCGILRSGGFDAVCYAFAAGEENKEMQTVLGICGACMEHKMDRSSMIIALGGGVVGDMAGFAAAIYMRGIRFVQVPTTLLSQSDSSVGGKTGVDFLGVKNILGAFWQPKHVYINVSTLKTLPKREFISGMGEVIKHGIIRDAKFYSELAEKQEQIKGLDAKTLIKMSETNCRIKAGVVELDEKESGIRAHLNFGHTIGHAIEAASDFKRTHGECVGLGMIAASYIANARGLLGDEGLESVISLLEDYGFEASARLPDFDTVMRLVHSDKKSVGGAVNFILPVTIGEVISVKDVTDGEIADALKFISV